MKNLAIAALFAVLAFTGCAAGEATDSATTATALLSPSGEQRTALLEGLGAVDPDLAHPRAVAAARRACKALQSGHPDGEQIRIIEGAFRMTGGRQMTAEQAGRILSIVKDNGFCVLP